MKTNSCPICGNPIKSTPGKVQKTYHRPCRDFKNFLEAAVRAVREMDPKPTPDASREIRHEATVASYRIGATVQPRDRFGQFC
jgi:transposase